MLQVRVILILAWSILLILQTCPQTDGFILRIIAETLQNNVAGEPITHERTEWNFDPEAAKKARAIYFEKNGFRSSKYIERLGVGLDGHHEERRKQQEERDLGRLNGEHNINYPAISV